MTNSAGLHPPAPFLEFRVDRVDLAPTVVGACVGYELQAWRCAGLAKHLLQWIPEVALSWSECVGVDAGNMVRRIGEAATSVYTSDKFQRRGEFGEILLHAIVRQRYSSVPLISKIYFKDSTNITAKGFDAVHIVSGASGLELWLGEAKLYADASKAMAEAIASLEEHFRADFLKKEFVAIRRKIDPAQPLPPGYQRFFEPNVSLDAIIKSIHVPVLITYNSAAVAAHNEVCQEYVDAFTAEVLKHRDEFAKKTLPQHVVVHLLLVPLLNKDAFVAEMHRRLKAAQELA